VPGGDFRCSGKKGSLGMPGGVRENEVLLGRYVISRSQVLGKGGFSTVFKGLDKQRNINVAVKVYNHEDVLAFVEFKNAVATLKAIAEQARNLGNVWARRTSCDNSKLKQALTGEMSQEEAAEVMTLVESMDYTTCMVELIDYSCNECRRPDVDSDTGLAFMVLELGGESLRDRLNSYLADAGGPGSLPLSELRQLLWSLVVIVWTLHTAGFVHLDIKPENVVAFRDVANQNHVNWKLIDLDGAVQTGEKIAPDAGTFSPMYISPEYASSLKDHRDIIASRLMDVWSVAMCAMDAIFLQPVLEPWYDEWNEETGDDVKFFRWLADCTNEPIVSGDMRDLITGIDYELCTLLEGMLVRNPNKRLCMAKCLAHPYFAQFRLPGIEESSIASENRDPSKGMAGESPIRKYNSISTTGTGTTMRRGSQTCSIT